MASPRSSTSSLTKDLLPPPAASALLAVQARSDHDPPLDIVLLNIDPLLTSDLPTIQLITEFLSSSRFSGHLEHLSGGTRKPCWLLACIILALSALLLSLSNIISFLQFNTTTTTTIRLNKKEALLFPAVTVCNANTLYNRNTTLPFHLQEFCELPYDTGSGTIMKTLYNISDEDYMDYGPELNDFIITCTINAVDCSEAQWTAVVPDSYSWGKCWTLTPNATNAYAVGIGVYNAIELILDVEEELYCGSISESVGVRLALHDPGSWPDPSLGISLAPASTWTIGMGLVKTEKASWPYGECRSDDHVYFGTNPCYDKCVVARVASECKCNVRRESVQKSTVTLPYCDDDTGMKDCADEIVSKWYEEESQCECPLERCKSNEYLVTGATGGRWPSDPSWEIMEKMEALKNLKPNEIVNAKIYFDRFRYEEQKEIPALDFVTLLSNVGGSLGLCLGMSLVSLGELFELGGLLVARWRMRWRRRRTEKEEEEEELGDVARESSVASK